MSVVIISYNEEKNIERCIQSCLNLKKSLKVDEIILSDSCSIDNTIEIAKKYPIKIIQLKSSRLRSASAGRYIGSLMTSPKSNFIFFVDGDMQVIEDWPIKALRILDKRKEFAAISGFTLSPATESSKIKKNNKYKVSRSLSGAMIIKKDVLLKAGNFNPYLKAIEEGELMYRIRNLGYKCIQDSKPHVIHYGHISDNLIKLYFRKLKYFYAEGSIFRLSFSDNNIFWQRCYDYISYILTLLAYFSCLFLLIGIEFIIIPITLFLFSCLFCIQKKRSFLSGIKWSLNIVILSIPFVIGIFKKIENTLKAPLEIRIIKE